MAAADAAKKWCQTTTMHGPQEIIHTRSVMGRMFWGSLLFVSFVSMAWNVGQLLEAYLSVDNWTSTVKEVREAELPFPYLTLCNFNRISRKKAERANLSLSAAQFLYYTMGQPSRYALVLRPEPEHVREFEEWRKRVTKQDETNLHRVWDAIGPDCRGTFSRLSVKNRQVLAEDQICARLNKEPDADSFFTLRHVYTTEFGRCFQLKILDSMTGTGSGNGLSLILDNRFHDQLATAWNDYLEEGFAFQLTQTPAVLEGNWDSLSAGRQTRLSMVSRRRRLRTVGALGSIGGLGSGLGSPPPCATEDDRHLHTFPDEQYSRPVCEEDCQRLAHVRKCGCLPDVQGFQDYQACTPIQSYRCLLKDQPVLNYSFTKLSCIDGEGVCSGEEAKSEAEGEEAAKEANTTAYVGTAFADLEESAAKCAEKCQRSCTEQTYRFSASLARFPNKASVDQLMEWTLYRQLLEIYNDSVTDKLNITDRLTSSEQRTDDDVTETTVKVRQLIRSQTGSKDSAKMNALRERIQRGYASLNLYMNSMSSTVAEMHRRLSASDLAGQVGGVVGFFMGISLITLVQSIIYLFNILVEVGKARAVRKAQTAQVQTVETAQSQPAFASRPPSVFGSQAPSPQTEKEDLVIV